MSPGKRGIILFQLFLHLSKSTNPILIDQPEDNLDNRTVYQELNDFIRTKKSTRQIIIVSHNPNLVVSTDSENIIVANQDGQNKSGKNDKFQFEYVNGSIEHSFTNQDKSGILFQSGIRQHVCDVLEGGEDAFEKREVKYGLKIKK
jgi:ABC-type cobalamin/Fe3+-siderophores transport system ATPase subunit